MNRIAISVLSDILESTQSRVRQLSDSPPTNQPSLSVFSTVSFQETLSGPGLSVIAELKRRSPSRGQLWSDPDPVPRARQYIQGGAAAISVLTEPDFFSGSPDDLTQVKREVPVPVLRKDFIIDSLQVTESKQMGADALLLIVAALDKIQLAELLEECRSQQIEALVEVHDEAELERTLEVGAELIGVNCRDLNTFTVDLSTAERLAPRLEGAKLKVAESGIRTREDMERMGDAGYQAVLVGESLVTSPDPVQVLSELQGVPV